MVVVPEPADQAGHRKRKSAHGGRPVSYDALLYRNRNVVERCINTLKSWRGIATRYDEKVLAYRGELVLAAILMWLS